MPLIGARTRERLAEALGAMEFELSFDQLAAIEAAMPVDEVAGDWYRPSRWRCSTARSERGESGFRVSVDGWT